MHGGAAVRKDWEPRDLGGCRLWLRSDKDVSIASSGRVQAWTDQITRTKYTQTTDANRPTYGAGLQGRPKIVTAGSHALYNTSFFLTGPMTMFLMVQFTSLPTLGNSVVPVITRGASTGALRSVYVWINVGGYPTISWKNDLSASGAGVGYSAYTTAARCYVFTYNGGTNTAVGNYTLDDLGFNYSPLVTNPGLGNASAFYSSIGASVDDPGATISAGSETSADFYEMALWNRPLSASERMDLYGYANRMYGVHL